MSDDAHIHAESGFTLIEVLVAFLILSMALGGAMASIAYSSQLYRKADELSASHSLAQQIIAEKFWVQTVDILDETGEGPKGLRWRISTSMLQDNFARTGKQLRQFELEVSNGRGQKIETYRTLYVAP